MLRQNPAQTPRGARAASGNANPADAGQAPGEASNAAADATAVGGGSGTGAAADPGPSPKSAATEAGGSGQAPAAPSAQDTQEALARYAAATDLPWYGLDAGWQGARSLGTVSTGPDGVVEFGTLRHGDPAAGRPDARAQRRSVTVLSMARLGRRPLYKPDGAAAGSVEAMTVSAAAAIAGVGLVEDNWPWQLDAALRQRWLEQQRELAYVLGESLGADPWHPLTLSVGDDQQQFHYRESPYGWVLAAARPDCFLAAYGRGVSAYSLAFVRVDPALYV